MTVPFLHRQNICNGNDQTNTERKNVLICLGDCILKKHYGQYVLNSSGWTNALSDANIATSGTAESFLSATHIARTHKAHEITALALALLQKEAYMNHLIQSYLNYHLIFGETKCEIKVLRFNFGTLF